MTRSRSDDDEHSRQSQTILLAADDKHSILAEVSESQTCSIAYSAYGHQSTQQVIATRLGFNGELQEARLGWYFLGKGYRVYNPVLMRFHSPDSWSPFGKGGLNAYMYCVGDPVNYSDPTGHVWLLKKLLTPFRPLTNASSTSSLAPLVSRVDQQGVINPHFIDTAPIPRSENIPTITERPHTPISTPPPPRQPKQPFTDSYGRLHFNDTGGRVSFVGDGGPKYNVLFWKSRPSELSPVPFPRTTREGVREYRVKYKSDVTTQSSFIKTRSPLENIRDTGPTRGVAGRTDGLGPVRNR